MAEVPPRLAILTPAYNRAEGLRRLHASLARQDAVLDWFHVVVDDASAPPLSPESVGAEAGRLVFERHARNRGPLAARNTAIELALARGADLVAFIDDDDTAAGGFFCYVAQMWREHRDLGWYVSRCRFVGPHPGTDAWPEREGIYDWFDDVQLARRFDSDAMHVVAAERLRGARFSEFGRYQREWTLLAQLARGGGFYASSHVTKEATYDREGLTLRRRGAGPDFATCLNYVSKPAVIVRHRPYSAAAWKAFLRQLLRFPLRLLLLAAMRLGLYRPCAS